MKYIGYLMLLSVLFGCSESVPKPRSYFRIDLPQKEYTQFQQENFPFSFEYPKSVSTVIEKAHMKDSVWLDIVYPKFNAKVYCTYRKVNNNFQQLSEDSRRLVYKPHTAKADAITEQIYLNDSHKVYGVLYELKGNAASNIQFVLSDSTSHFFRGSLYFNANPNSDSIAPVVNYIREDIVRLIETLEWK